MLRLWSCSRSLNARSVKNALGLTNSLTVSTSKKPLLFERSLQTRTSTSGDNDIRGDLIDDLMPGSREMRPTNFRNNRPDLTFSHKLYERIKDLLSSSKYHKALEALEESKAKGVKMSLRIYVMVIENLILAEQFQEAEMVLDMVRQDTSLDPGAIFFTQVIDAYFKRRKYKEAVMIYQEMKALRKKPTAMLIQIMINCFTNMNEFEKADQVWADFFRLKDLANDMKVGGAVYGAMMWSYFRRGDVTKSLEVYKQFKESGLPISTNIQNALLAILHSMGKHSEVMALYKSITSPTAVTYQRIITMAIEREDMKLMRETFNKARDEGLQLNLPTYNKILSAYCNAGMTKEALEFFDNMQDKMELSVHTYNALLSLFSRNGDSENFEKVANYLKTHDVQFNDFTYRVMLVYYSEKSFEKFEGLWHQLKDKKYPFTVLMYNDYLLGWERHGGLTNEKAISILEDMAKAGISPNEITFTNIISAKAKEGNFEEAMHWYHQMKANGIKPIDITFVRLLSCILHNVDNRTAKNMKTILDEMAAQEIKPNIQIYTQMIDILGESGNLKALHSLVSQIQQEGHKMDSTAYSRLIFYFSKDEPDRAITAFKMLLESGVQLDSIAFKTACQICVKGHDAKSILGFFNTVQNRKLEITRGIMATLAESLFLLEAMDELWEIYTKSTATYEFEIIGSRLYTYTLALLIDRKDYDRAESVYRALRKCGHLMVFGEELGLMIKLFLDQHKFEDLVTELESVLKLPWSIVLPITNYVLKHRSTLSPAILESTEKWERIATLKQPLLEKEEVYMRMEEEETVVFKKYLHSCIRFFKQEK